MEEKEIVLYTTHCPRCNILKQKLKDKNIKFIEETNVDLMMSKGMKTVPYLEIEKDKILNFEDSLKWVEGV